MISSTESKIKTADAPMFIMLPIPVSINNAYNNSVRGRSKTSEAKAWYLDAGFHAGRFIRQYQKTCDANLLTQRKYLTGKNSFGGPVMALHKMKADHPELAYRVRYEYFFNNDSLRDMLNFEKLLTDFLVGCGFMLDDNFIVEAVIKLRKHCTETPRAEIEIISLARSDFLV